MATAYLAIQSGLADFRKYVVVKRMHPTLSGDEGFCEMFLREARLAASLHHPNIVDIYEVGVDKDCYFLAMEYVRGVTCEAVRKRLGARGKFTFPMHLKILSDVLAALSYAYDAQDVDGQSLRVVHRDVSPQNIIVSSNGEAKLVDFGVAKAASNATHTASGVIKGKVKYMAPEQALGGSVDNRSDIYSVGVMLWELIAGRRYYGKKSNMAVLALLIGGKPPLPANAAKNGLPDFADEIVARALAQHPGDRYQQADDFRRDLTKLAQMLGGVAAAQDIASIVREEFADDDRRLRETIERIKAADTSATIPAYQPPASGTTSDTGEVSGLANSDEPTAWLGGTASGSKQPQAAGSKDASETTSALAVGAEAPRTKFSRLPMAIAALAVLLVFAGGAGWFVMRDDSRPTGNVPPTPNSVPSITLSVGANPSSARIYLDGEELESNPAVVVRPANSQRYTLVVEAPGYESKRSEVTFEQNLRININLQPISDFASNPMAKPDTEPDAEPDAVPGRVNAGSKPRPFTVRNVPSANATPPPTKSTKTSPPPLDVKEPW